MQPLHWLLLGIGLGVAGMVPLAWLAARRSERRERALHQRAAAAERMAEMGAMTGGLAHEIKNPLSTIGLNLQLLAESVQDAAVGPPHAGRLKRRIDSLNAEIEHLRGILEDFLRFAGRMQLEREPTDLNQLLEEVADFYTPQAEQSGVQLRTQLAAGLPQVPVDRSLIKQALLNLLINATQAMVQARYAKTPHGGSTELMLRTQAGADGVELHVTDTGPGIDEANRRRIFDPYFSTKAGGSGLGLPTTRRIAIEHGGELRMHSEVGKGSDFVIALPSEGGSRA